MFYKGLDPMLVRMTAYYRRPDRRPLDEGRAAVEQAIGAGRTGSAASDTHADQRRSLSAAVGPATFADRKQEG
jgi:hypothetical protein